MATPFPFATEWSTSGCVIQSWSVKYNENSNGGLGKDFSPCQKVGEVPQSSALTPAPWLLIWVVCCENVMMPGAVVAILWPWGKTTYALRQRGRAKRAWALNDVDLTNPPWDQSTSWLIYHIQMIISINHWHQVDSLFHFLINVKSYRLISFINICHPWDNIKNKCHFLESFLWFFPAFLNFNFSPFFSTL